MAGMHRWLDLAQARGLGIPTRECLRLGEMAMAVCSVPQFLQLSTSLWSNP